MRRGRDLRVRDRGTATVEFAIVVPLLLTLVFGIIDFGRMANDHIQLTAAARAAAQALAIGEDMNAAAATVFQDGTVTVTIVHQCHNPPDSGEMAQVEVRHDFMFVTPLAVLLGFHDTLALTAEGAVPCRA